jgi:hypothetical protein
MLLVDGAVSVSCPMAFILAELVCHNLILDGHVAVVDLVEKQNVEMER